MGAVKDFVVNHDPAFPVTAHLGEESVTSIGLSRRDYLAAAALTGLMGHSGHSTEGWDAKKFAQTAYSVADAMLAARKVGP